MSARTLAVLWTMLCGAAFVTLFSIAETDDVAGFVLAMLALQVPPFLALAGAPDGAPLSGARSAAIAVPAAFVGAYVAFFVVGVVAARIFRSPLDLTPIFLAMGATLLGCLGSGLAAGFYVHARPHPFGARRVLTLFAIASLLAGAIVMSVAIRRDAAIGVVMGVPLLWCVPLLLVTRRKVCEPVPLARVR